MSTNSLELEMWSQDWGCKLEWFLPLSWAFLLVAGGYSRDQPSVLLCLQPLLCLPLAIMGISKARSIVSASHSSWAVHAQLAQPGTFLKSSTMSHRLWSSVQDFGCLLATMPRNLAAHPTVRAVGFHWVQVVAGRQGSWCSLATPPRSISDQSQLPKVSSNDPKCQVLAACHPVCLRCNQLQYERSPDQQGLSGHCDSTCWSILGAIAQQVLLLLVSPEVLVHVIWTEINNAVNSQTTLLTHSSNCFTGTAVLSHFTEWPTKGIRHWIDLFPSLVGRKSALLLSCKPFAFSDRPHYPRCTSHSTAVLRFSIWSSKTHKMNES